jgi:tetratricopeptide (TPR) repeat protein
MEILRIELGRCHELVRQRTRIAGAEKYDEAIRCYDEVMKLKPDFADNYVDKANALISLDNYEQAIECCEEAIKLNPNITAGSFNKGSLLHALGKYDEAITCYDRLLLSDPENEFLVDAKKEHVTNCVHLHTGKSIYH